MIRSNWVEALGLLGLILIILIASPFYIHVGGDRFREDDKLSILLSEEFEGQFEQLQFKQARTGRSSVVRVRYEMNGQSHEVEEKLPYYGHRIILNAEDGLISAIVLLDIESASEAHFKEQSYEILYDFISFALGMAEEDRARRDRWIANKGPK